MIVTVVKMRKMAVCYRGIPVGAVLVDSYYFYGAFCVKCGILYEKGNLMRKLLVWEMINDNGTASVPKG